MNSAEKNAALRLGDMTVTNFGHCTCVTDCYLKSLALQLLNHPDQKVRERAYKQLFGQDAIYRFKEICGGIGVKDIFENLSRDE